MQQLVVTRLYASQVAFGVGLRRPRVSFGPLWRGSAGNPRL